MKANIHPKYYPKAKTHCACGNTFTIGATREEIKVEICSKCHPFYTGEEKLIDTAGRVEKFRTRRAKAEAAPSKKKKERTKKQAATTLEAQPKTKPRMKKAAPAKK